MYTLAQMEGHSAETFESFGLGASMDGVDMDAFIARCLGEFPWKTAVEAKVKHHLKLREPYKSFSKPLIRYSVRKFEPPQQD